MTVKGAEVFCYMLLHKGTTEISKWKLIDDIWPDKDVRKGDINLRSTISRLNKTFRDNGMGIAMKSTRNGYQLDIHEEIEVDVFLLETIANTSYSISVDNLISYELTILSYNDTLFEDFDSEWCIIYRNLYQRYYKIAVIKLIDYYKKVQQDPLRILNIIERITQFEPYDDEIREVALNLYYNGYGRFEAMKYYSDYIKLLRKDLGLEPGKKLRGCYKTLMQEL
jgi:two-component SAPR family response regulator